MKNNLKRVISLIMVLLLVVTLIPKTVSAAVKLNKTVISLTEGDTFALKVSGSKSSVKWTTSKKSVATVSTKGVVTAKKAGSATITATVSKKKYTCKVTVIEKFNATTASKNIKSELTDTGKGVIAILKNTNKYPVSLDATLVYMDANGKAIGKTSSHNNYFESGKECALNFSAPYDGDYNAVGYDSYKISYKVSTLSSYIKSALTDIEVESNIGVDNVIATVVNKGKKSPSSTIVSIVFYKGGEVIGYDYTYADMESPGTEDYLEFSFPRDENYDSIDIDDYKIFVNSSYYYKY